MNEFKRDLDRIVKSIINRPPTPEELKHTESECGLIYNFLTYPKEVVDVATGEAWLQGYLTGAKLWKSHNMCVELVPEQLDLVHTAYKILEVRKAALKESISLSFGGKWLGEK